MKLVIASTALQEVLPTLNYLKNEAQQLNPFHFRLKDLEVHILITGLETVVSTYSLTKYFQHQTADLLIHAGIGFSLHSEISEDQVYQITVEQFGNIDPSEPTDNNSPLYKDHPFIQGKLYNTETGKFLPEASGLTIGMNQLTDKTLDKIQKQYPESHILTTENAVVFYTALMEKVKFISLRSVIKSEENSNILLIKDEAAILKLNQTLINIILTLCE